MKLNKKIEKLVREYLKILERSGIPVESAYIFGSYAKGKADKHSDIDLAIISDKFGEDSQKERAFLLKLRNENMLIIEPHPIKKDEFENLNLPLINQIKNYSVKVI